MARACASTGMGPTTLNHDVVPEHAFEPSGVRVSDGFEKTFGTLEIWYDHFATPTRKLMKLHGCLTPG